MTVYVKVDSEGVVTQLDGVLDAGGFGPPSPPPDDSEDWHLTEVLPPARPSDHSTVKWVDGEFVWVDPRTLCELQAAKIDEMSAACGECIVGGFRSSALGSPYLYPAKPTDQMNLAGSVLDSLIANSPDWTTPFWCADSEGLWEFRQHTASQIQQVGRDGKAAIVGAMTTNEGLRATIMAAQTPSEVAAVGWPL